MLFGIVGPHRVRLLLWLPRARITEHRHARLDILEGELLPTLWHQLVEPVLLGLMLALLLRVVQIQARYYGKT